MQDRRNCDRSYGDRIYLHEGCAGWKNLSGSGVGVSHPVFLLKGKDHKTGRNGNGINDFDVTVHSYRFLLVQTCLHVWDNKNLYEVSAIS